MKYHRKEYWAVEAQQYDGSFDLGFLRPDERVRAGEPGGATVLIDRDSNPGRPASTVEVALGQWAIRLRDGHITAMDHDQFVDEYQPADAQEG
jgi:hypothetical protein